MDQPELERLKEISRLARLDAKVEEPLPEKPANSPFETYDFETYVLNEEASRFVLPRGPMRVKVPLDFGLLVRRENGMEIVQPGQTIELDDNERMFIQRLGSEDQMPDKTPPGPVTGFSPTMLAIKYGDMIEEHMNARRDEPLGLVDEILHGKTERPK